LTHADVRAIVLARFRELPEGSLWDVGAGLGGVAVELARAFPRREVVAVERSAERSGFLAINRARFGAYNLRLIAGEAPEALDHAGRPSGVFLGGSGGRLRDILALVLDRLLPTGRLVATFVGLENLAETMEALKRAGWPAAITQAQLSHDAPLAGLTTLVAQRPVWILRAIRPGSLE
jgi:precorrin-6Y C5,15-methyltransferase (decarboxylating)